MVDPAKEPGASDGDARSTLDELERVLQRIPGAGTLVHDVRELRALLVDRRPPRVAAIGRRGSGKSSLANALMSAAVLETGAVSDTTMAARWVQLDHNGRRMRWLDTPGLRAGDQPRRRDEVRRALANEPPDVILVACKASQVDAGFDEDAAEVLWLLEKQKRAGLVPPGVIAVLTKVDELAPLDVKQPPFEGEKRANIDRAVAVLRAHCERLKLPVRDVVPVGAYQRFFADGSVAVDWRWNLDALAESVFAALPLATHAEAARALDAGRSLRRRVARRIVSAATSLAFLIGITPWLPIADIALLTPLQAAMITGVIYLGGGSVKTRTVAEWVAGMGVNTGAGFALREAARALFKLLGPANTVSGVIAAAGTWAMGVSAIKYFIDGGTMDEARKAFEDARREGPPAELTSGRIETEPLEPVSDVAKVPKDRE